MNDQTKSRIRELMFYVVPDPDEKITEEVLERSEAVDYKEANRLKVEFRSIIESLDDHPTTRQTILAALDDLEASTNEARGDDVEWQNVCDVMGRRIRRTLDEIL
jgi:hypothetical protein